MERYYCFWRRLGADILDGLIPLPFAFIATHFISLSNTYASYEWAVFQSVFFILYNVLSTGLAGQTIGKLFMNIKVLDINEKAVIGIKRAFVRDAVPIILEIAGLLMMGLQLAGKMPDNNITQFTENVIDNAWNWWLVAELATMFLNPKRRAIHDLMASSVVISLNGLKFDKLDEELESKRLANLQ